MFLTAFCIVAIVLFLFLFAIWSKSNFFNFFLKFMWLLMAVWAILCSLQQLDLLK
jgi:hypothetical protein